MVFAKELPLVVNNLKFNSSCFCEMLPACSDGIERRDNACTSFVSLLILMQC